MAQLLTTRAKPFLKWAGGKTQLLDQMATRFPAELRLGKIRRYIEPFVGGGAVFFHIAQNYDVEEFHLFDVNEELVLAYRTVKTAVEHLIDTLSRIELHYLGLNEDSRRAFFYEMRATFNTSRALSNRRTIDFKCVERTAQLIFLNKTCFNGLFRVNSKSEFNVPFGRYKNPGYCDEANLRAVSQALQHVELSSASFEKVLEKAVPGDFVYFDPPYVPVSKTANFTAYQAHGFTENDQIKLRDVCIELTQRSVKVMLSNSATDRVRTLYSTPDFFITEVQASRAINSNGKRRGKLTELIVTNYPPN